jgi:hypothetical protein
VPDSLSPADRAVRDDEDAWRKMAFHECAMAAGKVFIDQGALSLRVEQLPARILEEMSMFVVAKYSELIWQRRAKLEESGQKEKADQLKSSPFV